MWIHVLPGGGSQQNSAPGLNFSSTFLSTWTRFSHILNYLECAGTLQILFCTLRLHISSLLDIWCLYVWSRRLLTMSKDRQQQCEQSLGMPVQELRIVQNNHHTIPVCHPLEKVSGWETTFVFQLKSPKPLSPLGPGLWHPTSPVILSRGSQPILSFLFCFFNHLSAEGWLVLEQILESQSLYPVFFLLCTICPQTGLQLLPVKKQIALAQGQDHSPGALPASRGFTARLLLSLKLPPATLEGCSGPPSYTTVILSLPPVSCPLSSCVHSI